MWMVSLLMACNGPKQDTDPELPPLDSEVVRDTDQSTFIPDTSIDSGFRADPLNYVTMHQWGVWWVTPDGGPYDAMTGSMWVQEYLDGGEPAYDSDDSDRIVRPSDTDDGDTDIFLYCDVEYALAAEPAQANCNGCSQTWTITYTVVTGNPGDCHDPELPEDQGVRRMGYHDADHTILNDFGFLGLYLPWYDASLSTIWTDKVQFDWQATEGVFVEEEDN